MSQSGPQNGIRVRGVKDCPPGYPVKGNEPSMIYYVPGAQRYDAVVPEICFTSASDAEAGGFSAPGGAASASGTVTKPTGRNCPDGYPIKGNEPSMFYYEPGDAGYAQVTPEACFKTAGEADAAGFKRHAGPTATESVEARRVVVPPAASVAAAPDRSTEKVAAKAPSRPVPPPPPAKPEDKGRPWWWWLLGALALAAIAAGLWNYFNDDDEDVVVPTVTVTVPSGSVATPDVDVTEVGAGVATPDVNAGVTIATPDASTGGSTAATPDASASGGAAMAGTPADTGAVVADAGTPASAATASPMASPAATLEIVSLDIKFEPKALTIDADTDVVISLVNNGAAPHNFAIDALNIDIDLNPGESKTVTINAKAGTYDYYCNVVGHKEAGMVGVLTVE